MKKTPRTYGTGTLRRIRSGKWRFEYKPSWATKRLSKVVEAESEKAAQTLLSDWVKELDKQGKLAIAVSIEDLMNLHLDDMRLHDRDPKNIEDLELRWKKHLVKYFAGVDFAEPLKRAQITKYVAAKIKAGSARASVNRQLAWLHRGLALAVKQELIGWAIPEFEKFRENNIRTGVLDDAKYYAILRRLPEHAQPVWCLAYRTGVRHGELLKLRAEWVRMNGPKSCIEVPGFDTGGNRITKSGKAHVLPLWHPEMRALVEMVLVRRDPKCPYLFQYEGKRLKDIRTGFEKARHEAGLDGLEEGSEKVIFHDTRRSAASYMVDEAGIDVEEAMEITGHLTRSMFNRYRIGSKSKAVATGLKMLAHSERAESAHKSAHEAPAETPIATSKSSVN